MLRHEPTVDICTRLGAIKGNRVLIGFAMEDHDHKTHAEAKLRRKGCDAIVLNPVATAGAATGSIEVYDPRRGWGPIVTGTKQILARVVVVAMNDLLLDRQTHA
jgi:phosphopantothenoylcysteine synthetase/decarboxylase